MKTILGRIIIYLLLITGSAIFLVPLVWMIATALKPIEQTMSMPPTWMPYRLYGQMDGQRASVKTSETIEAPSLVILVRKTGQRQIVAQDQVVNGKLKIRSRTTDKMESFEVDVLKEVPASKEQPWVRIVEEHIMALVQAGKGDASLANQWDVVPLASLEKESAPLWSNFGKAIKALGTTEFNVMNTTRWFDWLLPEDTARRLGDAIYNRMSPGLRQTLSLNFVIYLKNTLILCILTVIGTVLSSALAAYGFARIPWRGRNKFFVLALATMMIPFPVVMVPVYSMFRAAGWIGSLKPLWVGSFCAGAFNVFLLRQFFMTIPKDLSDAARIDGCSEFRIFWQIILPLCRPALMVVGLFQFMGTWNDFLGPLIYLTNQKDFTLALGLQFYQSQQGGTEWHYLMAASTLVVLPIIVLFFFTQKTFIEGISMTGLKG